MSDKLTRVQPVNGYRPTCELRQRYLGGSTFALEQLFESIYVGEEPQWRQVPFYYPQYEARAALATEGEKRE